MNVSLGKDELGVASLGEGKGGSEAPVVTVFGRDLEFLCENESVC